MKIWKYFFGDFLWPDFWQKLWKQIKLPSSHGFLMVFPLIVCLIFPKNKSYFLVLCGNLCSLFYVPESKQLTFIPFYTQQVILTYSVICHCFYFQLSTLDEDWASVFMTSCSIQSIKVLVVSVKALLNICHFQPYIGEVVRLWSERNPSPWGNARLYT